MANGGSGKVAVITGASSGIGLLTAVELARRGMRVVATMRDLARRDRLDVAAEAASVSELIDGVRLDVTDFGAIPGVMQQIVADYGRIDVLVNNAGFAMAGFAEDVSVDEIREQFETNFFGHVAVTKAALPCFRAQGSGIIIMVTSVAGRCGQPVVSSYSASKFALSGWSEGLRLEMGALGVKVAIVEPGAFQTDIWDRNSKVGELVATADSPNLTRIQNFRTKVLKATKKRDAGIVARLIADVAETANPRLRYMVGPDAKMQTQLRALLPWNVYEKLIRKAVGIG